MKTNRRWVMARKPQGDITLEDFRLEEVPLQLLQPGQVLVRNRRLSIDPANRAWMKAETYQQQLRPGDPLPAFALGEVVESASHLLQPGDIVDGRLGWQDAAVADARELRRRPREVPLDTLISLLGNSGLTAYHGLVDVGRLRPGETVVVSAAAGSVGSIAAQIAKIAGCRVVGIAGGRDKCAWLTETLRIDAAVDYKSPQFAAEIRDALPRGADLFFDNTGGDIFDALFGLMATDGRMVCCGSVAQYAAPDPAATARRIGTLVVGKRIQVSGFLLSDMPPRLRERAEAILLDWHQQGRLAVALHLVDGLEQAPQALLDLLAGANRGKTAVRLDSSPDQNET